MDLFYKEHLIKIDEEDIHYLSMYNWYISDYGYLIYRKYKEGYIRFHRLIMSCPENMQIDHIDGNRLNNCKSNLRVCTHSENMRNKKPHKNGSSMYKGVSFEKKNKKWFAAIYLNGKQIILGRFENEIDAALAYDSAAKENYGNFAKLNFPEEWVYDDIVYY